MSQLERLMYRHERWMYRTGHPNGWATVLNRMWSVLAAAGLGRNRLVTLEVQGRRTGRLIAVPLMVADYGGQRYLVAMLGERASWVANVRASGGRATLCHGRRESIRLEEVDGRERAPILKRHLQVAPAARSFVPVDPGASTVEFDAVAAQFPVFRICREDLQ